MDNLLEQPDFSKEDIEYMLTSEDTNRIKLFHAANEIKHEYVGNTVYYRGLVEFSNICAKNCYYCGIRAANAHVERYELTEDEILECAELAYKNKFGSLVIQSGERSDKKFVEKIDGIIKKIKQLSNGELGITLSLGEQSEETYQRWFESGAHRYLLRIEVSNPSMYPNYHPNDKNHAYENRIRCLETLRSSGYQVGTGVMIGLPFQTVSDLVDDLIFLRDFDIDMVGMGPYIEHEDTPLYKYKNLLLSKKERFDLSLKMVAALRIIMKDINIAATTAMQTLDPQGREKALKAGANIIMPNLTPVKYREDYLLYEDKPCLDEDADQCKNCLEARIHMAGDSVGFGEWGDSPHFIKRKNKKDTQN